VPHRLQGVMTGSTHERPVRAHDRSGAGGRRSRVDETQSCRERPGDSMMGTQEPGYRVLLLYSESRLTPSVVSADQALRSTLEARLSRPVHFYTEFLDLNSFHGASLQRNLRELVGLKYRERWIDLIVAQGQLSVPFTLQNRVELFSSAPVVFIAVEPSTFADPSVEDVATGTWRRRGWAETLDLASHFHPGTRRATVLVGSSAGERLWMEAARQQLAPYAGSIEISYLVDWPLEDVLKAAAALPKDRSSSRARSCATGRVGTSRHQRSSAASPRSQACPSTCSPKPASEGVPWEAT
jgi:hypothetical protein